MIDLHCHILPEVDDGSKNIEMSLEMAKQAEGNGITTIIATPHYIEHGYFIERDRINNKVSILQSEIDRAGINIRILPGSEVYYSPNILKRAKDGELITINNSRYLLVEFPISNKQQDIGEFLANLQMLDYKPIIAHPERYCFLQTHPNLLYDLVAEGILAQVNIGSLLGAFGSRAQKTAEILVEHNLVQLVGSDAHFNYRHRGAFDIGVKRLEKIFKGGLNLYFESAENVINNKEIEFLPPIRYEEEKKGLFVFFKRKLKI